MDRRRIVSYRSQVTTCLLGVCMKSKQQKQNRRETPEEMWERRQQSRMDLLRMRFRALHRSQWLQWRHLYWMQLSPVSVCLYQLHSLAHIETAMMAPQPQATRLPEQTCIHHTFCTTLNWLAVTWETQYKGISWKLSYISYRQKFPHTSYAGKALIFCCPKNSWLHK